MIMSTPMSVFVIAGTLLSLLAFFLLLHMNRTVSKPGETTGHNYDGIEEYDNPLPAWWYWGFLITIIFAIGYLIYYPGLGNFEGVGGWSSKGQLEADQAAADARYEPYYAKYRGLSLDEIAMDPAAVKMGNRLFINNCSVCHGAAAKGSFGFPNLTDEEWNWGSSDEAIVTTLKSGRNGVMMPWGQVLGDQGVSEAAEYVLKLAGRDVDEELAVAGETHFMSFCAACHGIEGKGQTIFGAPDLTNESWLYGNTKSRIEHVIRHGRNAQMPAFEAKLGEDRIRILAAYVKQLSDQ